MEVSFWRPVYSSIWLRHHINWEGTFFYYETCFGEMLHTIYYCRHVCDILFEKNEKSNQYDLKPTFKPHFRPRFGQLPLQSALHCIARLQSQILQYLVTWGQVPEAAAACVEATAAHGLTSHPGNLSPQLSAHPWYPGPLCRPSLQGKVKHGQEETD